MKKGTEPISPVRLGLAAGIVFGICTLIVTWLNIWFSYGSAWLNILTSIYPGYKISWTGSIVGMIYGFADMFIFFGLIGLIHNWLGRTSFYK